MLQPGVVLFDQLSDVAKERAVRDFIDFYLSKYATKSLEILTEYPIQYEIEQINHDINLNSNFGPEQLRDYLYTYDERLFSRIISALDQSFMENGVMSGETYDEWYQKKYDAIAPGL
ncbi:hypothetical protein [Secundilactobacillus folii]|uniref:Uncharacterized protein n=1 Tax=Secundilactobacillus folii TaxID=2678357 RepID=A0A7X3C2H6_9LACO|nr:hypothetical protein [Secundilactobacillus folii]MTV82875.1 hypothetical protein [Secundilactobacillus folii]